MENFDLALNHLYILKEGLPVFTKEYKRNQIGQEDDNQTLVSGFLSALVSFLKDMKDYGEMRSLNTSTGMKFSFYQQDSLIFVAVTEGVSDDTVIERFLRRVSNRFLEQYREKIFSTSMVNTKCYAGFESILDRELLSNALREGRATLPSIQIDRAKSAFSNQTHFPCVKNVPRLTIPPSSITKELGIQQGQHVSMIQYIDGRTGIDDIARLSGLESGEVHSFLRYLVKQGAVEF